MEQFNSMKLLRNTMYIMLAISLLTTCSAIYSAITLDTRRRRKEMALRKINGAKPKNIRKIFIRAYIILLAICTAVGLPVSLILLDEINSGFGFETSPILACLITAIVIVLVVLVTIYWKIKEVMSVDPVTYLKD